MAQLVKNPPAMRLDLGREDPLEEGLATHFCILAWRIPWTEEPSGATVHGVAKNLAQRSRNVSFPVRVRVRVRVRHPTALHQPQAWILGESIQAHTGRQLDFTPMFYICLTPVSRLSQAGSYRGSASRSHQQKGNRPQHGCSHGFHVLSAASSCSGTGMSVRRWAATARATVSTTRWNEGSVSGVRAWASEGSRDRSNSNGGAWWVTLFPEQGHTICP